MTKPVAARASDLPTRFAAAVVMIAVALAAIYLGGWPFRLLVLAGAFVMLLEWVDMHGISRRWAHVGWLLLAANLLLVPELLLPGAAANGEAGRALFAAAWAGFGAAAAFALLLGLLARRTALAGGFLYVAIPSLALILLSAASSGLVLWAMVVTWATDIFAYFAGRSIGGPKLAPRISPNKTWAGLGGGMAGAAALGALVAWAFDLGAPFLYIGGVMGLIGQLGDLYESSVKRRAGVKDSGSLLPGHGGVLDRVDGLLPVAVATFLLLAFGQWTG